MSKNVDSKGRLGLGKRFANRTVIIREVNETEIVVTLARVVPEREMWLLENQEAKDLVSTGLNQAAEGRFSDSPPDLEEDAEFADTLEGD